MSNTTSLDKITVDLLHRAVNFFRLGRPVSMRSVSEGLANKNYLLETDGGQYLVKDVLIHTPNEIELEMEYLDHILKNNFPAPSYIRGIKGARIFLDSGHILVVQKKFNGEHPEKTPEICRAVGKWLAKLHKIPHEGLPQKNHWMTPDFLPPYVEILRTSQLPIRNLLWQPMSDCVLLIFIRCPRQSFTMTFTRAIYCLKARNLQRYWIGRKPLSALQFSMLPAASGIFVSMKVILCLSKITRLCSWVILLKGNSSK